MESLKTSEEIYMIYSTTIPIERKNHPMTKQFWLSKEELEKNYIPKSRVEEFKEEIMNIGITINTAPIVFDLINRILLDKK